jgi:GTP cyclohydrolase I
VKADIEGQTLAGITAEPVVTHTGVEQARDRGRALEAVRELIRYLGGDPESVGLQETPRRVLAYYDELLGRGAEVIDATIPWSSLCPHHISPITGRAYVGYIANGRVLGLSKLARLIVKHAGGLMMQETMVRDAAEDLQAMAGTEHVAIVTVATHSCMTVRGVKAHGSDTITSTMLGDFRDRGGSARAEFLSLCGPLSLT